jgi:hypothetical protein
LPQGHLVTKLGVAEDETWWRVSTDHQGSTLEGFVKSDFLAPASDFREPAPSRSIREVHLETTNRIARDQTSGRAFPLNEPGQPSRNGNPPATLTQIIDYLKVDISERYEPTSRATFCNIYAYDYCYLAGVYLPRVWWTRRAIATLAAGGTVTPQYDVTVTELNANSLNNWFEEFGDDFEWRRTFDLTELQNAANAGHVSIISGQRVDLNKSGHICPVVPETGTHTANRRGATVIMPLQSQAGATNFRYGGSVWWTNAKFRRFSFWIHE